jgi:hypothetical protein
MKPANKFLVKSALVLGVLVCLASLYSFELKKSLWRANCIELRATWDRWNEAGRPQNDKLADFMRGRDPNILINTQTFELHGITYSAQFELQKLWSKNGVLIVTTNKTLLWVKKDGAMELIKDFNVK